MGGDVAMTRRAHGALAGLSVGDALGMPTQSLDRARIEATYGPIRGLVDAADDQPIAPGLPAGTVTDDTEQAMLVARLLVDGHGRVDPRTFAAALGEWEGRMRAAGSLDLLGPSTRRAIAAIESGGDPDRSGLGATTNGAAMRIAPVGIAVAPEPYEPLVQAVHDLSFVTHNSSVAVSAAAAIAGAVSAGVGGAGLVDAIDAGLGLAERAVAYAPWAAAASVPVKTRWAIEACAQLDAGELADFLVDVVGTSVQAAESVVAALVIAHRFRERPFDGLCFAAGLGGDTDTIAAMAGAVLGSVHGADAFGSDNVRTVLAVSQLDLDPVVDGLLELRRGA